MTNLFKILLKLDGCQKNIMCRNCKKAKAYTNIKFLLALRTSGLWEGSTGRPIWGKFGVTLCYNHLQYTCTNFSLLRHVYIQRTSRSIAGQQQEVKYLNLLLLFLLFPWTRRHNAHTHCIDVIHICSKSFCSEFFVFGKKFVWHSNILILIFVWRFFLLLFDANFCWNFAWSSDAIVCLILQRVHQRWMRQEVVTNHHIVVCHDTRWKCEMSLFLSKLHFEFYTSSWSTFWTDHKFIALSWTILHHHLHFHLFLLAWFFVDFFERQSKVMDSFNVL